MVSIQENTVKLAVEAGFEEVDKEDVQEVLNSHKEKLPNKELIQLDKEEEGKKRRQNEDAESNDKNTAVIRILDTKKLLQVFKYCKGTMAILDENGPN